MVFINDLKLDARWSASVSRSVKSTMVASFPKTKGEVPIYSYFGTNIHYKNVTYKYVTYKYVTYKNITYKNVTYKNGKYESRLKSLPLILGAAKH